VISLGSCATRTVARRKLREHIEAEGVNSEATLISTTTPGTTFREQAKRWIASLATRRRRPVKPATIFGWQHALDKWILPTIGDMPLAEVSNAALKLLIETMATGGLAAKTIVSYSLVPKLVVASVVTADGEQVYPRKWNHDFVGLPIIDPSKQHRPTVNGEKVCELASHSSSRFAVLFSLMAGTGLRIGEALAVRASDFTEDFRVLKVTRSHLARERTRSKNPKRRSRNRHRGRTCGSGTKLCTRPYRLLVLDAVRSATGTPECSPSRWSRRSRTAALSD
jgi:integrase